MERSSSTLLDDKSEASSNVKDESASAKSKKKTYTGSMKLVGFGDLRRSLGD